MFRHGVEFENSDISKVVDVGQPRHVGHGRSSADVEEYLAGLEQSTVDAYRMGPFEPGVARIELESVIFVARTIGDADILLVGTDDSSSAGGVERRPVYRLIASSAGPCGVAKTVLMADEDLVGSEGDR